MTNDDIAHSKVVHKYFFKASYNKTNKKEYDLQIWQYNVCHTTIIVIKAVIVVVERDGKNKELLAMENIDKTVIVEVAKVLSVINLESKHSWASSNTDIDMTRDLGLINKKKYWRCTGQI